MLARAPFALSPYLLVARVLLFLVFITSGIQEMSVVEFTGSDAERIRRLVEPPTVQPKLTEPSTKPVAWAQASDETDDTTDTTDTTTISARALYRHALVIEDAGWSNPGLIAWISTLLQLVGSALLLVGLLSRLWGFGLCLVTAAAFVISSIPLLQQPWAFLHLPPDEFNQVAAQMGLFGLALVIVTCGPGEVSLDRLIFGRARRLPLDGTIRGEEDEKTEA